VNPDSLPPCPGFPTGAQCTKILIEVIVASAGEQAEGDGSVPDEAVPGEPVP
jgi:hypothetical protein